MASINVSVNDKGLVTITLDKFEWKDLIVNGKSVPPYTGPEPNVKFKYEQTTFGDISFHAIADNYLVPINPPFVYKLLGKKDGSDESYVFGCYCYPGNTNTHLIGTVNAHTGKIKEAKDQVFQFNQGRMTGVYENAS